MSKKANYHLIYQVYCKPTFIRVKEIFARFMTASSSQIFLAVNQSFSYGCYNNIRVWMRFGRNHQLSRTNLSELNREIKSSRIKVGIQYLVVNLLTIHVPQHMFTSSKFVYLSLHSITNKTTQIFIELIKLYSTQYKLLQSLKMKFCSFKSHLSKFFPNKIVTCINIHTFFILEHQIICSGKK